MERKEVFDWRERLVFPIKNRRGEEVSESIAREHMKDVSDMRGFLRAYDRIMNHKVSARPSEGSLKVFTDEVRQALGSRARLIIDSEKVED